MAERNTEKYTTWWRSCLNELYQGLTSNDPVEAVDLIFVMAGRMERKHYGLELYRAGIAPRLILSVGRFEVSKMSRLDLEGVDELVVLRERTQPDERPFFVEVDLSGVHIESPKLPRWNTYGEALGLRQLVEGENALWEYWRSGTWDCPDPRARVRNKDANPGPLRVRSYPGLALTSNCGTAKLYV